MSDARQGRIIAIAFAAWACRLAVGATFLIAGTLKAMDPPAFLADALGYGLVFGWPVVVAAFLIPWVEIIAGAAILLRRAYPGAVFLSCAMLVIFLVAILQAWARGLHIECACFGRGGGPAYGWWITRDVALLAACVICALDAARGYTEARRTEGERIF